MSTTELPEWLTEEVDGSVTVSFADLKRPLKLDGTDVGSLRMREPTVQDQITADKQHGHRGDGEVALIANLTEQSPAAIGGMSMKQYRRCQTALEFFTG